MSNTRAHASSAWARSRTRTRFSPPPAPRAPPPPPAGTTRTPPSPPPSAAGPRAGCPRTPDHPGGHAVRHQHRARQPHLLRRATPAAPPSASPPLRRPRPPPTPPAANDAAGLIGGGLRSRCGCDDGADVGHRQRPGQHRFHHRPLHRTAGPETLRDLVHGQTVSAGIGAAFVFALLRHFSGAGARAQGAWRPTEAARHARLRRAGASRPACLPGDSVPGRSARAPLLTPDPTPPRVEIGPLLLPLPPPPLLLLGLLPRLDGTNVILLTADDQGWGDVGYNPHEARSPDQPQWQRNARTPKLDAMARSNGSSCSGASTRVRRCAARMYA